MLRELQDFGHRLLFLLGLAAIGLSSQNHLRPAIGSHTHQWFAILLSGRVEEVGTMVESSAALGGEEHVLLDRREYEFDEVAESGIHFFGSV